MRIPKVEYILIFDFLLIFSFLVMQQIHKTLEYIISESHNYEL